MQLKNFSRLKHHSKLLRASTVKFGKETQKMTDSDIIQILWGNPELEAKFEINPYGLSQRELLVLQLHEKLKLISPNTDVGSVQKI